MSARNANGGEAVNTRLLRYTSGNGGDENNTGRIFTNFGRHCPCPGRPQSKSREVRDKSIGPTSGDPGPNLSESNRACIECGRLRPWPTSAQIRSRPATFGRIRPTPAQSWPTSAQIRLSLGAARTRLVPKKHSHFPDLDHTQKHAERVTPAAHNKNRGTCCEECSADYSPPDGAPDKIRGTAQACSDIPPESALDGISTRAGCQIRPNVANTWLMFVDTGPSLTNQTRPDADQRTRNSEYITTHKEQTRANTRKHEERRGNTRNHEKKQATTSNSEQRRTNNNEQQQRTTNNDE